MAKDDLTKGQKDAIKHYEDANYKGDVTSNRLSLSSLSSPKYFTTNGKYRGFCKREAIGLAFSLE